MGQPVVHFEIIGKMPEKLREFYRELFGWEYDTAAPVAPEVSDAGNYGFIDAGTLGGTGIPGGIGGGGGYEPHTVFYVGVPDVEVTLAKASALGGTWVMGPAKNPGADLLVGHLTDPEGNLVGVAGPSVASRK